MMVACWLAIVFVALPSGKIVASFDFGYQEYTNFATVLGDGRIYAAGTNAHCTRFQVLDKYRVDMK